jgi:hypothetical protein
VLGVVTTIPSIRVRPTPPPDLLANLGLTAVAAQPTQPAQPTGRPSNATAAAQHQDAMRNQMALQAQQQHFQMMQQMMRQQFESQMIINSNLGGNTTYSYRW